ncbi:MAG: hypothetical protein MUQ43_11110, partial [Reinekea forsetii]|nr:hypothetical protein [Reinekea forsetii]
MTYLTFQLPTKTGDIREIANLSGSAIAFALGEIMEQHQQTLLCIVDSPSELEALITDLEA